MADKRTQPGKANPPSLGEMVSAAMNEQGFLFSQRIEESIRYPTIPKVNGPPWAFVEREYPVTASDSSQTRIDLVFRNVVERGVYACFECKRADPLYKRWVFFDEDEYTSSGTLWFEIVRVHSRAQIADVNGNRGIMDATHAIRKRESDPNCKVFNCYVEVAIDRGTGRAGYTENIETAFLQVMKGHTGMMAKLLSFEEDFLLCSIPIVITTAELFRAVFHTTNVSLKTGKIDAADLTVEPLDFCAVNYHPNDQLAIKSGHIKMSRKNVKEDLEFWQRRTIFVVSAEKADYFLSWLSSKVASFKD